MNPHTLPTIKQYISDSCRTFQEKTIPGGCQKNGSFAERFRALKHHSRRLRRMAMVFLFYRSELFWPLLIGDLLKKPCGGYAPFYLSIGTTEAYKQELSS